MIKFLWIIAIISLALPCESARRKGYRFRTPLSEAFSIGSKPLISEIPPDSVTIRKYFLDDQIITLTSASPMPEGVVFSGFDKKRNNSRESFFIINGSDKPLAGVLLAFEYRTPDGRMLHRRYALISITIPPRETKKVDLQSWDTQRSFYYVKSESESSRGNPFDVTITPLALIIETAEP